MVSPLDACHSTVLLVCMSWPCLELQRHLRLVYDMYMLLAIHAPSQNAVHVVEAQPPEGQEGGPSPAFGSILGQI